MTDETITTENTRSAAEARSTPAPHLGLLELILEASEILRPPPEPGDESEKPA